MSFGSALGSGDSTCPACASPLASECFPLTVPRAYVPERWAYFSPDGRVFVRMLRTGPTRLLPSILLLGVGQVKRCTTALQSSFCPRPLLFLQVKKGQISGFHTVQPTCDNVPFLSLITSGEFLIFKGKII